MTTVGGWIDEENFVRLLRHLSGHIGYRYDAADEDALSGALDDTDDESENAWSRYPLMGTPSVVVRLARAVGGSVVSVHVEGDFDRILEARIETMLDLL